MRFLRIAMVLSTAGLWMLSPMNLGGTEVAAATPKRATARSHHQQWGFQPGQKPDGWAPVSGRWSVVVDPEHPGNRVLRQSQVDEKNQVFLSRETYANFDFSVRLRTDTFKMKTQNWQAGIFFRRADNRHYYRLRVSAANLALSRMSPLSEFLVTGREAQSLTVAARESSEWKEQVLLLLPLGVTPDHWTTLGINCLGEKLTVRLDGQVVRMLYDPAVGRGRLGLFTHNTQAFFDDLELSAARVPDLTQGVKPVQSVFQTAKDHELLVYYFNPGDGPIRLNILTPDDRVFNTLTQGMRSQGLNSVTWNGQGVSGRKALPGVYTLDYQVGQKHHKSKVRVQ